MSKHCVVLICHLHSDAKEHVSIIQVKLKAVLLWSNENNIFFELGHITKGETAFESIQKNSVLTLSNIIFVDDKEKQIEQLKNKFKKR